MMKYTLNRYEVWNLEHAKFKARQQWQNISKNMIWKEKKTFVWRVQWVPRFKSHFCVGPLCRDLDFEAHSGLKRIMWKEVHTGTVCPMDFTYFSYQKISKFPIGFERRGFGKALIQKLPNHYFGCIEEEGKCQWSQWLGFHSLLNGMLEKGSSYVASKTWFR